MFNIIKIKIMKKLAYVLVVMFVAVLGTNTYASTILIDNNETIVIVDNDFDKKPCPADCKGECCKDKAKADASKAGDATAKAGCDKAAKSGCDKSAKSSCGSKSAAKTDAKTETADKK